MITEDEAARAVLNLLNTPLVNGVGFDDPEVPMRTVFERLDAPVIRQNLSSGERALVNTAEAMWRGKGLFGSGGLPDMDETLRMHVLAIAIRRYT